MQPPPLPNLFLVCFGIFLLKIILVDSRIQAQVVRVEEKDADHLTTNMALVEQSKAGYVWFG